MVAKNFRAFIINSKVKFLLFYWVEKESIKSLFIYLSFPPLFSFSFELMFESALAKVEEVGYGKKGSGRNLNYFKYLKEFLHF